MNNDEILKKAKESIESIKNAQQSLANYLERLEVIVKELEQEKYFNEHLTLNDVKAIKDNKIEAPKDKRFKLNIFFIISIISLLFGGLNHYFNYNNGISTKAYKIELYSNNNMEPLVKFNSLVVYQKNSNYQIDDLVAYRENNDVIIRKVVNETEGKYTLISNNYNFEEAVLLPASNIQYKVKSNFNIIGNILAIFSYNYLYIYLFASLNFIVGIFYYQKN